MIKNQRQYNHTKKQAQNFREALALAKTSGPAEGVHPRMHVAYVDGLEGDLERLEALLAEYDSLASGNIETIELDRLDKLPAGLIKARIARGLSHKDLAARLDVKPQQIQRWEFEDYQNVGFSRMVEIAKALEISVAERIFLPGRPKSLFGALKELGIDRQFLVTRLVPRKAGGDTADCVVSAAERLSRIFGIELLGDGKFVSQGSLSAAAALRFKLPANAESQRTKAYAAYVAYLANVVLTATTRVAAEIVPNDWKGMRTFLFGNGPISLAAAIQRTWQLGIPVVPLSDPVRMHGCCMRVRGRNVIVLKQSQRYTSRWLFDLLHELHHAADSTQTDSFVLHDEDATSPIRRESEDENSANEFAGNVLLNGRANELYDAVLTRANSQIPRLKAATIAVSEASKEDVGVLANYVAYRLKVDRFIDWWGAAANLQAESEDAFVIARGVFLDNVDLQKLDDDDRELLDQALFEPEL